MNVKPMKLWLTWIWHGMTCLMLLRFGRQIYPKSLEIKPMTLTLLAPCSTIWATGTQWTVRLSSER